MWYAWEIREMRIKLWTKTPKGKGGHSEIIGAGGKIILEWTLGK